MHLDAERTKVLGVLMGYCEIPTLSGSVLGQAGERAALGREEDEDPGA